MRALLTAALGVQALGMVITLILLGLGIQKGSWGVTGFALGLGLCWGALISVTWRHRRRLP